MSEHVNAAHHCAKMCVRAPPAALHLRARCLLTVAKSSGRQLANGRNGGGWLYANVHSVCCSQPLAARESQLWPCRALLHDAAACASTLSGQDHAAPAQPVVSAPVVPWVAATLACHDCCCILSQRCVAVALRNSSSAVLHMNTYMVSCLQRQVGSAEERAEFCRWRCYRKLSKKLFVYQTLARRSATGLSALWAGSNDRVDPTCAFSAVGSDKLACGQHCDSSLCVG